LTDKFPDVDPYTVRFTDMHKWITELPNFGGDPAKSNEAKLEAIQMAWHEEWQDRTRAELRFFGAVPASQFSRAIADRSASRIQSWIHPGWNSLSARPDAAPPLV